MLMYAFIAPIGGPKNGTTHRAHRPPWLLARRRQLDGTVAQANDHTCWTMYGQGEPEPPGTHTEAAQLLVASWQKTAQSGW